MSNGRGDDDDVAYSLFLFPLIYDFFFISAFKVDHKPLDSTKYNNSNGSMYFVKIVYCWPFILFRCCVSLVLFFSSLIYLHITRPSLRSVFGFHMISHAHAGIIVASKIRTINIAIEWIHMNNSFPFLLLSLIFSFFLFAHFALYFFCLFVTWSI